MPVVAFGVDTNRLVVVESVQQFTLGALGCPFLLAYRTVYGESDEHFGHGTLLRNYGASAFSEDCRLAVKASLVEPCKGPHALGISRSGFKMEGRIEGSEIPVTK